MKKLILVSFMLFTVSLCYSQSANSRRVIANTLSGSLGSGNYCNSFGDQDLMLVFKGQAFDSI
ncbi:MAG: hypothetical protein HN535_01560 [Flavobacteriales bacterium]|nr:hypothetical protein [Flavobacteriales bacterium]